MPGWTWPACIGIDEVEARSCTARIEDHGHVGALAGQAGARTARQHRGPWRGRRPALLRRRRRREEERRRPEAAGSWTNRLRRVRASRDRRTSPRIVALSRASSSRWAAKRSCSRGVKLSRSESWRAHGGIIARLDWAAITRFFSSEAFPLRRKLGRSCFPLQYRV